MPDAGPAPAVRRSPALRLVALFTAVAGAVFGLPAAFGATWLLGDNLIQNFPLRVLVGTDLRHGHLPLWNPYLWSGAPLLAGFNAGAAYPATLLFAVLPGTLAWVLNQVAVEVVAATGVLVLARLLGRSWLAAGLAAGAFAFGGFMTAQSVHLDLVQAASWLPWAFVAVDRLAHRPAGKMAVPWVALLAAALGLMILSGAVEPIFDGGIAVALYVVWLAWRTPGRRRLDVVVGSLAGLSLGVVVAAAQLVPGAAFQAQSQRAMHTYGFFTSGSMNKGLTLLGLDPMLLGGSHPFPLNFVGTFNLPEISSYIGILPVMALVGLLARRHRRAPEAAQWWIWYAIVVVGLLLTWGGFTPVAHLVYDIPLYNRQRLLNRNLLEVDLALAMLFAVWVDRMFVTPAASAVSDGSDASDRSDASDASGAVDDVGRPARGRRRWSSDVVLPLVPVVAVVGLQLTLLIGGGWLDHLLHVPGTVTRARLGSLVAFLTVPSAIALAAGALVVFRARLARRLPALLVAVLVVDLLVFNAGIQSTPDTAAASSATSAPANRLAADVRALGPGPAGEPHRLGIFDPDRFYPVQQNQIGQPDLTLLRHLDDVQGYGAVVDERYDAATGSHLQLNLSPTALSGSTFTQLDLGLLVTVPESFVHLVGRPPHYTASMANGAVPLPPVSGTTTTTSSSVPSAGAAEPGPTPRSDYTYAAPPSALSTVAAGSPRTQYFGTILRVSSVTVPLPDGGGGALRVGLLSSGGAITTWLGPAQPVAGRSSLTFSSPPSSSTGVRAASGIVLSTEPGTAASVAVGAALVATAGQGTYRVDGSLRDIVTTPRWHFDGMDMPGVFAVFASTEAMGRAWVAGRPSAAHVVSDTAWGAETIRVVTPRRATLVRAVQYAAGWQATVTDAAGGDARAAAVQRHGLQEAVTVPAGVHLVDFRYRPARAYEGIAVSAVGVLVLVALAAAPWWWRRRRRPGAPGPAPDPPGVKG
ncbi:MAG: hypothetical protein ACRDY1_08900 [Acidimicrobiales bacterium]